MKHSVQSVATLRRAAFLAAALPHSAEAAAGTLERIRTAGKLTLGYRADARPFSYKDESGKAGRLRDRVVPARSSMR